MYAGGGHRRHGGDVVLPYRAWRKLSIVALGVSEVLLIVVLHPSVASLRTASSSGGGHRRGGGDPVTARSARSTIQSLGDIAKLAPAAVRGDDPGAQVSTIDDLGHATLPFILVVAVLLRLVI